MGCFIIHATIIEMIQFAAKFLFCQLIIEVVGQCHKTFFSLSPMVGKKSKSVCPFSGWANRPEWSSTVRVGSRLARKKLPGANTLAYFTLPSVSK